MLVDLGIWDVGRSLVGDSLDVSGEIDCLGGSGCSVG